MHTGGCGRGIGHERFSGQSGSFERLLAGVCVCWSDARLGDGRFRNNVNLTPNLLPMYVCAVSHMLVH